MLRTLVILLSACFAVQGAELSGASALEFTRKAVNFGPRPAGSEANRALQAYILGQLKSCRCEIMEDAFTATSPRGPVAMKNIIAKFPGKSGRAIVLTGHFDTKLFPDFKFVGASDGGSSTGLLLELARALTGKPRIDDVYVVFLDGEEAFGEWSSTDSVYGSRHLAAKWRSDGTLTKIKALINLDMIGDKSLNVKQELNGNGPLRRLFWTTAADLGYQAYFPSSDPITIDDDHMPFIRMGVPAIDIIDFDYPPWHSVTDTLDKLSAQSLEIVGTVTLEVVRRLER